jgi:hypothetical protein
MKLLTAEIKAKLEKNAKNKDQDHKPVVKLFNPIGGATWLLTELEGDSAFGLCDLGQGTPELGSVSISEIENIKLAMGLKIERDLYFTADKTLSEYAKAARDSGSIAA